jgi:uncharacterized protein YjiS (DUF1127 family)
MIEKRTSTMSANTTANHIVYQPSTMSYSNVSVKRPVSTSRPSGLEAAFVKAVRFLASIPQRHAVKTELSRLSDRELSDIGLSRSEIAHVFSRTR